MRRVERHFHVTPLPLLSVIIVTSFHETYLLRSPQGVNDWNNLQNTRAQNYYAGHSSFRSHTWWSFRAYMFKNSWISVFHQWSVLANAIITCCCVCFCSICLMVDHDLFRAWAYYRIPRPPKTSRMKLYNLSDRPWYHKRVNGRDSNLDLSGKVLVTKCPHNIIIMLPSGRGKNIFFLKRECGMNPIASKVPTQTLLEDGP